MNNIDIIRNKKFYLYEYDGKIRKYYPDFLVNGSLIEIKGYYHEINDIKLQSVNDNDIRILYKDDLYFAFNYVKENYKYKNLTDLYESKY